jgi:hypothetical protein
MKIVSADFCNENSKKEEKEEHSHARKLKHLTKIFITVKSPLMNTSQL